MRAHSAIFALLLGLAWLALTPAAAQGKIVGHVVGLAPAVAGQVTEPPGPSQDLHPGDGVVEDMEVATGKRAGANVTVEGPKRGAVRLAAETRVVFKRWVINAAQGEDIPFSVQIGHFLAAFAPHPDDKHTVYIDTPTARIRLEGTLIDVQVAPDGSTSVFVVEGAATVTATAGGAVHLTAGTRTEVSPGLPPSLPAPANPLTGTLSPPAAGPAFHGPGFVITDPPRLDLRELQLDLPRVDRQ